MCCYTLINKQSYLFDQTKGVYVSSPISPDTSMQSVCNSSATILNSENEHPYTNGTACSQQNHQSSCTTIQRTPELHIPKTPGLIGLKNLGNTCYMNAALQALSNCPELIEPLVYHARNIPKPGLSQCFAMLLQRMWVGDTDLYHRYLDSHSGRMIEPKYIEYAYLTPDDILHEIRVAYPAFRNYFQQQDAQEFLRCFLNKMHEELKVRVDDDLQSMSCKETPSSSPCLISSSSSPSLKEITSLPSTIITNLSKSYHSLPRNFGSSVDLIAAHRVNTNERRITNGVLDARIQTTSNAVTENGQNPLDAFDCNGTHLERPMERNITSGSTDEMHSSDSNRECILNETGDHARLQRSGITVSCQDLLLCGRNQQNHSEFGSQTSIETSTSLPSDSESSLSADNQPALNQNSSRKASLVKSQVKYRSIVSDVFDGQLISSVQCLSCQNVSTVKETFQDLSLPIPNKEYIMERQRGSLVNSHMRRGPSDNTLSSNSGDLSRLIPDSCSSSCSQRALLTHNRRWRLFNKCWLLFVQIAHFVLLCLSNVSAFCCHHIRRTYQWMGYWFCGPSISLDDCLAAFFSTDELTGNNKYRCDNCKRLRNGIKYANILEAPSILCIHLKRFKHELMYTSKIHNPVSFPLRGLDLSLYIHQNADAAVYDLVSLVCHRGNYNSGHYITYALNSSQNSWFVYDDKIVRPVDESTVAQAQAYVLFYRKRTEVDEDGSYSDTSDESDRRPQHKRRSVWNFWRFWPKFNRTDVDPIETLRMRKRYARPQPDAHVCDPDQTNQDILDQIQFRIPDYEQ